MKEYLHFFLLQSTTHSLKKNATSSRVDVFIDNLLVSMGKHAKKYLCTDSDYFCFIMEIKRRIDRAVFIFVIFIFFVLKQRSRKKYKNCFGVT